MAKPKNKLEQLVMYIPEKVGSFWSLIVHTVFFIGIFILYLLGLDISTVMLILTTLVSLEAIYLSIFIQMSINHHTKELGAVKEDIADIQEDVEDLGQDVDKINIK